MSQLDLIDRSSLLKRTSSMGSSTSLAATTKAAHKLPGIDTKERQKTKLPVSGSGGALMTTYTSKDSREYFQKKPFPVFLDLSGLEYQLDSDEFLTGCQNIFKEINLSNNSLYEVKSISHLTKLKRLILDRNNLVDVSLTGLTSLIYLSATNNRIAHVPDLIDLKKVLNIDLNGNRLIDGFEEFSKLKTLKCLDLGSNGINMTLGQFNKEVLGQLKKVKSLEYVSFQDNYIERNIPEFRLFVANELKTVKYINWIYVSKDERTRAAKMETERFWDNIMHTSFPTPAQPEVSSSPSSSLFQSSPRPSGLRESGGHGSPLLKKMTMFGGASPLSNSTGSLSGTSPSSLNSSTGSLSGDSVPLKNMKRLSITSSTDGFVAPKKEADNSQSTNEPQQKLNVIPDLGDFGFSKRSTVIVAQDNVTTSTPDSSTTSPDITQEIIKDGEEPVPPFEDYLDVLLDELPPIEGSIDFTSININDRSVYLDHLYKCIVDGVLSLDLLMNVPNQIDKSVSPVTNTSATGPVPNSPQRKSQWVKTTTSADATQKIYPSAFTPITEGNKDELKKEINTLSSSPSLKPAPTTGFKAVTPSGSPSSPGMNASKPLANLKRPASIVSNSPGTASGSPSTAPSLANVSKSPAKPKPIVGANNTSNLIANFQNNSNNDGLVVKKVEVAKKPDQPTSTLLKDVIKKPAMAKPAPTTASNTSNASLDVNKFSMDIEKALQDIEDTYQVAEPVVTVKKEIEQPKSIEQPTIKQETTPPPAAVVEQPKKEEVKSVSPAFTSQPKKPVTNSMMVVDDIVGELNQALEEAEKIVKPTPPPSHKSMLVKKDVLKEITMKDKPQDVNSATRKLNDMIEEFGRSATTADKKPPTPTISSPPQMSTSTPDLDKLLSSFDQQLTGSPSTGSPSSPSLPPRMSIYGSFGGVKPQWITNHDDIQLGNKLGVGSYGDVHSGRISQRAVTLKRLRVQRFSDQFITQFTEECGRLRSIPAHDNVTPITGACVDLTIMSISPYVEGVSVQHVIDTPSFQISNELIVAILSGVAQAMVHLHQHGVIHRGLKPSNILLDKEGTVTVRDYGFNFIKDGAFRSGSGYGNFYMAPELYASQCNSYTPNVDQYSFALIAIELFTKSPTFPVGTQPHKVAEMLRDGYRPEIPEGFPTVFDRLVRACWHQDPASRPTFLTISKILQQPIQRLFTSTTPVVRPVVAPVSPPTPSISISEPTNTTPRSNSNANVSLQRRKQSFMETGELARKMALVVHRVILMLKDVPTMEKALKTIESLAVSADNIQYFVGVEIIQPILRCFIYPEHHELILRVLSQLCSNEEITNEFVNDNGLMQLVRVMNSTVLATSLQACKLLTAIADEQHLEAIRTSGALKVLFVTLQSSNADLQMQSVWALSRVLVDSNNQSYFIDCGGVQILLEMMNQTKSQSLSNRSLMALCCLVTNERCNQQLLDAGMLPRLMTLMGSPAKLLRTHALGVVQNISADPRFCQLIVAERGVSMLCDQITTSTNDTMPLVLKCLVSLLKVEEASQQFYEGSGVERVLQLFIPNQDTEILLPALNILMIISKHDACRLKARLGIPRLMDLINRRDNNIEQQASIQILYCLSAFSTHSSCVPVILDSKIIESLISIIENALTTAEVKQAALKVFSSMAKTGNSYSVAIYQSKLISLLLNLTQSSQSVIKEEALSVACWLSSSPECRNHFIEHGIFKSILTYIAQGSLTLHNSSQHVESILWAISFFSTIVDCQTTIRQYHQCFEFVVKSLGRDEDVCRMLALKSVLILSQRPENREQLKKAGIIIYLQQLMLSQNQSLQLASKKILMLLNQQ